MRFDVAVVGSGFAGSILARALTIAGRKVALIDPRPHPRFAIGESSTPIADEMLRRLGRRFDHDRLVRMSRWGTWTDALPTTAGGLKRGFSYYRHRRGEAYAEAEPGESSMLIAASASDAIGDTHWHRSAVDAALHRDAIAAGVTDAGGWRVVDFRDGVGVEIEDASRDRRTVHADWIVDAGGRAGVLHRCSGRPDRTETLRTATACRFAHLRGVGSMSAIAGRPDDPFDGDDAAQHHWLGCDGWCWMLRVGGGITSVGRVWPAGPPGSGPPGTGPPGSGPSGSGPSGSGPPGSGSATGGDDLRCWPTLDGIVRDAQVVAPEGGWTTLDRVQFRGDVAFGRRTVALPTAAATIDPMHSTGIAHALVGAERMIDLIIGDGDVDRYVETVNAEIDWIDTMVAAAYDAGDDWDALARAVMSFIVAAIDTEERLQAGEAVTLFGVDDSAFRDAVRASLAGRPSALDRWNRAGLFKRADRRYAYTATK